MNVATQKRGNRTNANGQREPQPQQTERGFGLPEANIVERKDQFVVTAEMPGVDKDGLELTLENNVLTIVGRRKDASPSGTVLFRESTQRDFRRVFELAPSIDGDKIQARIEQGVLTLELPKAEKVKPRKITVSS
jgi:HSP20 family protein